VVILPGFPLVAGPRPGTVIVPGKIPVVPVPWTNDGMPGCPAVPLESCSVRSSGAVGTTFFRPFLHEAFLRPLSAVPYVLKEAWAPCAHLLPQLIGISACPVKHCVSLKYGSSAIAVIVVCPCMSNTYSSTYFLKKTVPESLMHPSEILQGADATLISSHKPDKPECTKDQ
jgi:hypothetical protein